MTINKTNNKDDDFMSNWDGMPMKFEANEELPVGLQKAMANGNYGNMTILQAGANGIMSAMTMNADGTMSPAGQNIPCEPGAEFTAYIKEHLEPFPYNSMAPARIDRRNLWPGRRLRLQLGDNNSWQEATVVQWEEWNTGPFCPVTKWNVTIRMLDEDDEDDDNQSKEHSKGDLVQAHGLKSAKGQALNGCIGTILKLIPDTGRYAVELETADDTTGYVKKQLKPENIRPLEALEVIHCDIESGGQLRGMHKKKAIDFEWLDAPVSSSIQ